jgi:hypothetical protein
MLKLPLMWPTIVRFMVKFWACPEPFDTCSDPIDKLRASIREAQDKYSGS